MEVVITMVILFLLIMIKVEEVMMELHFLLIMVDQIQLMDKVGKQYLPQHSGSGCI